MKISASQIDPIAISAEVGSGLDHSTRQAVSRLGEMIRTQKQQETQQIEQAVLAKQEPKKNPAFVVGLGSIAIAKANRRIREAQKQRGKQVYQSHARSKVIGDVEEALLETWSEEDSEFLVDKAG